MKKLMVIDGNSIVNRAFYGVSQNLSTREGQPTNAIFGFLNILNKLLEEDRPDALCVTFDRSAPTFRHQAYSEYKANRDHHRQAGVHPYGENHHPGRDPGELPGGVRLRAQKHHRPEGPHGRQL